MVVPVQDETCQSYERRLANANHLTIEHLRAHAGLRSGDSPTIHDLTILTGLPRRSLLLALPELRSPETDPPLPLVGRIQNIRHRRDYRPACRRCAAARAITETVHTWVTNDQNVCLQHNIWIGARDDRVEDQADAAALPEVVAAQRRHHNLIRRHGRAEVAAAYDEAAHITLRWTEQGYWAAARIGRLDTATGHSNVRVNPNDPLLRLINYPETVSLAGILVSPYWRHLAAEAFPLTVSAEGSRFAEEVRRRTGIEDYEFMGPRDPLQQWCDRQRQEARFQAQRHSDGDHDRL
ncbi:TniQ family protein [Dactylosporangium sp. NPDC050688]|uniref:TniQ family protein n=1 Tax=Dactylosporangium sp. NPDC050688 TaxID=3157217 RepID=UPI0033ECA734